MSVCAAVWLCFCTATQVVLKLVQNHIQNFPVTNWNNLSFYIFYSFSSSVAITGSFLYVYEYPIIYPQMKKKKKAVKKSESNAFVLAFNSYSFSHYL